MFDNINGIILPKCGERRITDIILSPYIKILKNSGTAFCLFLIINTYIHSRSLLDLYVAMVAFASRRLTSIVKENVSSRWIYLFPDEDNTVIYKSTVTAAEFGCYLQVIKLQIKFIWTGHFHQVLLPLNNAKTNILPITRAYVKHTRLLNN